MRVCSSGVAMMRDISVCSRSTISLGVPRGEQHVPGHRFGVGDAGGLRERRHVGERPEPVVEVTASARSFPPRISSSDAAGLGKGELHVAGGDVLDRLRADLVGHMRHLHAEAMAEVLAGEMRRAADRGRAGRDLAGLRLDVCDQVRDRMDRQLRVGPQHEGRFQVVRGRHEAAFGSSGGSWTWSA